MRFLRIAAALSSTGRMRSGNPGATSGSRRTKSGGFSQFSRSAFSRRAASPIRTEAALTNTGSATIDAGTILDASDPNLLDPVTITFVDANNYSVNGGPPIPYTSGAPIASDRVKSRPRRRGTPRVSR